MAMAVELFAPDEASLAPDDEALLALLTRNHACWLPFNRKAHCWAFYQCVGAHPHSVSASVLRCIVCKPDRTAAPNAVAGSSLSSRKGFLKYTNGGGTTPLKNHCRDHHRRLVDALKTRIGVIGENALAAVATSSAADSKKRKTITAAAASEIATQFSSLASYYSSSSSQQQQQQDVFIEDLILYVCKALSPISTTENVWFRRLLLHQAPRLVFPSRRQITEKYLPAMVQTLDVETVCPLLSKCVTGSTSFDLWMSRGTTDVFAVGWHFIDNNWEPQHVTIGMFQALPSVGSDLAIQLLPLFQKYDLERRCLAYVKDDSGNLDTTGAALDEITSCDLFQLAHPFPGDCFAHAALKMCTYGTDDAKVAIGLHLISIEHTQSVLRKTIACLRKSGAQEWSKACIDSGLVPKEMKTPVKMRFASKISIFHTLIEYKPAVNRWYGSQPSMALRNQVPSLRTWAIASVVTETLEPVLHACIANWSCGHWLISDAVNSIMTISTQFAKVLPLLPQCHSSDGFEVQLHALRINIRAQVQVLDSFLEFAVVFQSNKAQNMLALMLDPRFKSMRALSKFRGKSIAKELIKEYDDKVLIPFLIMAHENIYPAGAEGDNGNEDQRSGSDSEDDVFKTARQVVGNVEELVKNELMQFRTFKVGPDQPTAPLAWWKQHACMFPVIAFTARQFLAVPGSQIEVERIFSIAGILTSLRRANLGVQNLESILLIGKNWSDDPRFETSSAAAPSLKSFFDSEASLIEDHEDELQAAGLFEDGEENIE